MINRDKITNLKKEYNIQYFGDYKSNKTLVDGEGFRRYWSFRYAEAVRRLTKMTYHELYRMPFFVKLKPIVREIEDGTDLDKMIATYRDVEKDRYFDNFNMVVSSEAYYTVNQEELGVIKRDGIRLINAGEFGNLLDEMVTCMGEDVEGKTMYAVPKRSWELYKGFFDV